MKLNKIMLAAVLVFGVTSVAQAGDPVQKDEGRGSITFTGSIVEAPCSIDPNSIDQTVDLGQVSNVTLLKSGKSKARFFEIKLEGCTVKTGETVKVTFGGPAGIIDGSLGMSGTAEGASIVMNDSKGRKIKRGSPTSAFELSNGDNTMVFSAYLQGNPDSAFEPFPPNEIVPGTFKTVSNFTLSYQ